MHESFGTPKNTIIITGRLSTDWSPGFCPPALCILGPLASLVCFMWGSAAGKHRRHHFFRLSPYRMDTVGCTSPGDSRGIDVTRLGIDG